ncbi:S-layer homology domain-containing protein [Candidatus Gracilibacteria bacterium]|nr:S-layer homology domain-containing protein [Candidatus Gracilibacteria bacterium]NUJ99188.1 S-layer homology domain-containing protein [Candidatus Gracilibacteria bacterium]
MSKKIIAFTTLIFSLFYSSSFAFSGSEGVAANFLAGKGYITNNSTNVSAYRLDDGITRKEFMKIVAKINGATVAEKCEKKFSDVDAGDWGCKYIEWALSKGFVAKNTSFRPNDSITITEALKLIFKARNIEKKYNTSSWQADYINSAYDLGMIGEKYSNYTSLATRGWIFFVSSKTFSDFVVTEEDELKFDDASLEAELNDIFDLIDGGQ